MPPTRTPWSVATVPPSYGSIEDSMLCRHVRVRRGATLNELKRAILKAFEDQYAPAQITLYTRKYDDEPTAVRTDRQCTQLLSYGPDWEDLAGGDHETVLLIVSARNDEENELLVIPAVHPVAVDTVLRDVEVASGPTLASLRAAQPLLRRLATDTTGLFDPLPLPGHIDDWQAQYREALQSTSELVGRPTPRPTAGCRAICVQPIHLLDPSVAAAADDVDHRTLFGWMRDYLSAFYYGTEVRLLPPIEVRRAAGAKSVSVLGKEVRYRNHCPGNDDPQPHGQLCAPQLLRALAPRALRGKGGTRSHVGGALPPDGFCVLGVTLTDVFIGEDDVFTGGLAMPASRAGLLSFHRYLYEDRRTGVPCCRPTSDDGWRETCRVSMGAVLARACKTASHEVAHNLGIGHCLHRACLMNGAGHLLEDFAAPLGCCPVDLAKLLVALGPTCEVQPRYQALLAFCEAHPEGFVAHAAWLRNALAAVASSPAAMGNEAVDSAAASKKLSAVPAAQRKRAREAADVDSSDNEEYELSLAELLAKRGKDPVSRNS